MTPERLEAIKAELSIIRRGGQDPTGRYPELWRELIHNATKAELAEVRAAILQPPANEKPGGPRILGALSLSEFLDALGHGEAKPPRHCSCPACERWQRVEERAWEYMLEHKVTAACAVDLAMDLERETLSRKRWEASEG